MGRIFLPLATACFLICLPVTTASADDRTVCAKATGDDSIGACTRRLSAGSLTRQDQLLAHRHRGDALWYKGDYDGAIADYSALIRLDPSDKAAFKDRALSHYRKREFGRAIDDATDAIRLDPKFVRPYEIRGDAYYQNSDYDKAIADYSEAIRLGKLARQNVSSAHRSRGDAFWYKGDYNGAIADYSEVIRLNASDKAAFKDRGVSYYWKRDFDRAIADTTEAIRLDPKFARAYKIRGDAWWDKGDYDKAIGDYDEVIRLDPGNATAFKDRGISYFKKGEFDRAVADTTAAIRLDPTYARPYTIRADAWAAKGELARALQDYDEAIRIDPRNLLALNGRGLFHERGGNLAGALADFRAVVAINPQQGGATERIRRIEERLAAAPPLPASTENRIALIIGNSAYVKFGQLANPRNDAEKLAAALKNSGFSQVTLTFDLAAAKLRDTLNAFAAQANRADWAIIYYAGHGIEVGGVNYLVPVDATLSSDRDVASQTVEARRALLAVEGARKLRLVILDACRDNPFAKTMKRSDAAPSIGRGLAEIEPEGATLVAFAAKHGQQAEDGRDGNSPFATALVKHIETPAIEINFLFRKVRDDVIKLTSRRQEPYTYGSLPAEEFYFRQR